MALSEFDIIRRYFARGGPARTDVALGIGDDAALVRVPPGAELAVAVDTQVDGVHFPRNTDPEAIGYKALAVNLSDLAAMGAEPAWATLALTLPAADEAWLAGFARGFSGLADQYGVELVGGDTTRGPLAVTVSVYGLVPAGTALRRAGARPGDAVYVTGTPGDAAAGLRLLQSSLRSDAGLRARLVERLERPRPRVAEGLALRGVASAAIDISDGLTADLGHILEASGVGATLWVDRVPLSHAFRELLAANPDARSALGALALTGGDDYELCFTAPADRADAVSRALQPRDSGFTAVGVIDSEPGLRCVHDDGRPWQPPAHGYRHFG